MDDDRVRVTTKFNPDTQVLGIEIRIDPLPVADCEARVRSVIERVRSQHNEPISPEVLARFAEDCARAIREELPDVARMVSFTGLVRAARRGLACGSTSPSSSSPLLRSGALLAFRILLDRAVGAGS